MYPADGYAVATCSRLGREAPPTLLYEVNCDGTENTISECPESIRQCVTPGAGVICPFQKSNLQDILTDMPLHGSTLPKECMNREVMLQGVELPNEVRFWPENCCELC